MKVMRKTALLLLFPLSLTLSLYSCSNRSQRAIMDELGQVVESSPDSVLSVLGKMDKGKLSSQRLQADYILLNTIALSEAYGNIPLADEPSLRNAAEYFGSKGPEDKATKAFYHLGKMQLESGNPGGALVSLSKAENLSKDDYLSGRICREIAKTFNYLMNNADEASYMKKAAEYFAKAGYTDESGMALLQTGQAYFNLGDYDSAEEIYKSVLYTSHQNRDTLLEVNTLRAYSSLNLSKSEQDPVLAINMLARVSDQLGFTLSSTDKGNLAYAYCLLGRNSQADKWLAEALRSAESDDQRNNLRFREYQIKAREGNNSGALSALESVMEKNNESMNSALIQSVISSQKSYYEKETSTAREKLESARLRFYILVLFIFILAIIGYNYYRLQRLRVQKELSEEKAETERVMSLAEDLRKQLQEVSNQPSGKMSENFEVLERLCEQFYIYEGTDNLQPKILKEVNSIIDELRSNPAYLEQILNSNSNGIMKKFRSQFPLLKEEDIRLFCFNAAGLSSTTISTLFGKDKQYIYNRLYRLKGRISSSNAPDKDLFMKYISKG